MVSHVLLPLNGVFTPTKLPILFFPREVFIFPSLGKNISLVREKVFGLLQVFYTSSKNSSLFTRVVYHVDLKRIIIVKRQNASSHLFTPLHAYAYLNCVKTREDM